MTRRDDLSRPRAPRSFGIHYDPEAFGNFSETIARTLGTGRYLMIQTIVVLVWIMVNVAAVGLRWDPYPFILLNLAFSTQAAYAAPLILLAQNRQADRDRSEYEEDREVAERTKADTEFLAREIASIRLALADVVTTEDLTEQFSRLTDAVERLADPADPSAGLASPRAGDDPA